MKSQAPDGDDPLKRESAHEQIGAAMRDGWAGAGNFTATILSGMFLGLLADAWLGTKPWLVITGIIVASVGGFYRMMEWAREQERRGR